MIEKDLAEVLSPPYWERRLKANEALIEYMENQLPIIKADAQICRKLLVNLHGRSQDKT